MAAMLEDSQSASGPLIGCTQITEILNTPGTQLVGLLPKQFELATPYWAAVTRGSSQAQAAALMVELLSAPAQAELRKACGFE
jgi:molybdate transport system substrate-binding protein